MSYEIEYGRQFIKINFPDLDVPWYLPLSLHGSNNTYEVLYNGREKRARNWSAMYFNGQNTVPVGTEQDIMSKIKVVCDGSEYQQHFMRNGKWVDDAALVRYYKNGIKDAKTIEELNELSRYNIVLDAYLSIWENLEGMGNTIELRRTIKNSEELIQFLLEAKLRIRNRKNESIYVCVEFQGEKAIPYPKEVKQRAPERTFDDEYWVLKSNYHSTYSAVYISQLTARRIKFTGNAKNARKFGTEKEALKWVEKMLVPKGFNKNMIDALEPIKIEVEK